MDLTPRQRLDPAGRTLVAISVGIVAVLFATALEVIAYGAWVWRTIPNPDPLGFTSGLFFTATILLLLSAIAAVFVLISYVSEYRTAWTAEQRDAIARRWTGTLFILAGIPFFGLSFVLFGAVGQLMGIGALVAFGTGGGYLIHAYLASGGVGT